MKKLYLLGLVFILCLGVVNAVPDGGVHYYNMDELGVDSWGSLNLVDGASQSSSYPTYGILGDGADYSGSFDGTSSNLYTLTTGEFDYNDDYSISAWFNADTNVGQRCIYGYYVSSTNRAGICLQDSYISYRSIGGTDIYTSSNSIITTGTWYHVLITHDSSNNINLYLNGNLQTGSTQGTIANIAGFYIGKAGSLYYWDGLIDEVKFYNIVLNSTQISDLYNYGVVEYTPSFNYMTISAYDYNNATSITTFNATLTNGTVYNTTDGTITTDIVINETNPINYDFNIQSDGYISRDFTLSSDSNHNVTLLPQLLLSATDVYTTSAINTFNATLSNGTIYTTTDGTIETLIGMNESSSDSYTITFEATNYFDNQTIVPVNSNFDANMTPYSIVRAYDYYSDANVQNFNVTTTSGTYEATTGSVQIPDSSGTGIIESNLYLNKSFSIDVEQYIDVTINPYLNITATDYNGDPISNFTVSYTNPLDLGDTSNYTTTGTVGYLPIFNGTYNVSIDTYDFEFVDVSINPLDYSGTYSFDGLRKERSLYLTFKDIFTRNLINEVAFTIFNDDNEDPITNVTTNGTLALELLIPDTYRTLTIATNYTDHEFIFDIAYNFAENQTLYLIPDNTSLYIEKPIQVIDYSGKGVAGARVKTLRQNTDEGGYDLIAVTLTNIDGYTVQTLPDDSRYYKFIVEYDGVTKYISSADKLYGEILYIQIDLENILLTSFFNDFIDLDYDLIFNSATNNTVYTYNQLNTIGTQTCLFVYVQENGITFDYDSTCSTVVSNTITSYLNDTSKTYTVVATYLNDGKYYLIDSLIIEPESLNVNYTDNLFIFQIILTLVLLGVATFGGAEAMIITLPFGLIIGRLLTFNAFTYQSLFILQIVAIIIAFLVYRER